MTGPFLGKGINVGLSGGGFRISIDPDGKISANITLHTHYEMVPLWVGIAAQHLEAANVAEASRKAAWTADDQEQRFMTLEREFAASMQSIIASAVALDAFYAAIKPMTSISDEQVAKWNENRTARPTRITEVMKQAFKLKNEDVKQLKKSLKDIFMLRDEPIHPYADLRPPCLHPELGVHVDARLANYRAENARASLSTMRTVILDLAVHRKPATEKIAAYTAALAPKLKPQG